MSNNNQTYQNMPFGPGTPTGITPTGYSQGQGSYNKSLLPGNLREYGNQYQSKTPGYFGSGMNSNGGFTHSQHSFSGKQSVGSQNQHSSNLATAPVRTNSAQNQRPSSEPKFGGPVQAPSRTDSAPTNHTSPKRIPRGKLDEEKGVPTPGPKPHALDVEFSSEPRNTQTPILRSRRGQSISTAGTTTDPPRKNNISNWFDNAHTVDGVSQQQERMRSPPKMVGFTTSTNSGSVLTPINEGDPFSTPERAVTSFNNPFAPSKSLSVQRGRSRGPNGGMSIQFNSLTCGGTRNPSIDEALDPLNLPFVEYCRLVKTDKWGVIKIKNVSLHS